jgi:hypothetical protein
MTKKAKQKDLLRKFPNPKRGGGQRVFQVEGHTPLISTFHIEEVSIRLAVTPKHSADTLHSIFRKTFSIPHSSVAG